MLKTDSLLIHGTKSGKAQKFAKGAVNNPIYQSSVFESYTYEDVRYIRFNNTPNQQELERKISNLEGTESAAVGGSGMAVISAALLSLLKPGDRLLAQRVLYGGTLTFLKNELQPLGIGVDFVDGSNPDEWQQALTSDTKAFYCESITNPLIEVADLEAISNFCRQHTLTSIIDNTFATPINLKPKKLGFDITLHSATKFLNGFSDVSAGVIAGKQKHMDPIRAKIKQYGAPLDPNSCYLLNRGLKTLSLRIKKHNHNAMEMAQYLQAHPAVRTVLYPGLASHPKYETAKKLFSGYGGMLSFEIEGDGAQADNVIKKMKMITAAPSLGGVESLVMRPAAISHSVIPPNERKKMGINDELIRLSIGIEDISDLINDIEQALQI